MIHKMDIWSSGLHESKMKKKKSMQEFLNILNIADVATCT